MRSTAGRSSLAFSDATRTAWSTQQEFRRIQREIGRRTRKLLTATEIGVRGGRVRNRFKMPRHLRTRIEDSRLEYARKTAGIEREAALDGPCIVRTSETGMPTANAVRGFKQLTRVEKAFRCLKSVDLKVRPIRQRAERRVRAHLFVCMLAYYVEWHLRSALAPQLFQHEDLEGWQAERDPVAAAEPPQDLQRRKNRRRSEDGLRLHSFSSLLQELATRSRHRMRSDPKGPLLIRLTDPTPLQKRAMELWRAFPVNNTPNPAQNAFVSQYFRLDPGGNFGLDGSNRPVSPTFRHAIAANAGDAQTPGRVLSAQAEAAS